MGQKLREKGTVSVEELVLSMVWERDALYNLLERKGLITKNEILKEISLIKKVKKD